MDLDRLNQTYDQICGPVEKALPPSLELIQHWLEQHRDRQTAHYLRHILDAGVENVEEARKLQ